MKMNDNIEDAMTILKDMAKDLKDMKQFMHVLMNKLNGML